MRRCSLPIREKPCGYRRDALVSLKTVISWQLRGFPLTKGSPWDSIKKRSLQQYAETPDLVWE